MSLLDFFKRNSPEEEQSAIDFKGAKRVRAKMQELCKRRQNCEVVFGNDLYTSIFLEIESDHFLIDILMPSHGNDRIEEGHVVQFNYFERAVPYTMQATYAGRKGHGGEETLRFAIPEIIRHSNRRAYFRVAPSRREPVRLIIDFGASTLSESMAKDISGSGISLQSDLSQNLHAGHSINRVEIRLPGGNWVSSKGIIRRIQGTVVGIELEDIQSTDRRQIVRYVSERQKEILSAE